MLKIVTLGLATLLTACAAAPGEPAPEGKPAGEEAVGAAQQELMSTGFNRTYYSDSSLTVAVGWEVRDCDPSYNEFDGEKTKYYKQTRYNCPGSNMPGLPSTGCYICYDSNEPYEPHSLTCVASSCPVFGWP
ncbi:MAG TPA: hypothetical protein VFS43_15535 [Polyangiaceae bacterium]|nr:hypothetical protein [Polyangiaceae bacterium]